MTAAKPKLLSGGNPQIAKGDGDAPVQAYIAAMPGWKRGIGERVDALVVRTVPDAHKAVKWNSPFYGLEGNGWFLSLHCYTNYVRLAFFQGAHTSDYTLMAAASVIVATPVLIVYVFLQRHFIRGMLTGAVKG